MSYDFSYRHLYYFWVVAKEGGLSRAAAEALNAEINWVFKTWGGAAGAIASGTFWGVWLEGRLVSVAGTFFCGEVYEDLGVATEPAYRAPRTHLVLRVEDGRAVAQLCAWQGGGPKPHVG